MEIDVLLDPFSATWSDVRAGASAAEAAGFGGIWVWDHLAGRVHGADRVLEAWTVLSAVAAVTERVRLGPLVLNVANRDPGTLAVMAATLQEVSGGRLLLGLGAGGGPRTPYAREQQALGRTIPGDAVRRQAVVDAVAELRRVWADRANGFLDPVPPPPIVIGAFGPVMAELAGRVGDGLNTQALSPRLPELVATARAARPDPQAPFLVTVFAGFDRRWLAPASAARARLEGLGIDRLILLASPPYRELASTPAS